MKKLYIGNIGGVATSEDLSSMCSEFGQVTRSKVATDRETGKSRGFGFVEMQDGGDAAIAGLNNREFQGRNLKVSEAKPREDRPRTGGDTTNTRG
jgi:RNA recognition motif-containing protein